MPEAAVEIAAPETVGEADRSSRNGQDPISPAQEVIAHPSGHEADPRELRLPRIPGLAARRLASKGWELFTSDSCDVPVSEDLGRSDECFSTGCVGAESLDLVEFLFAKAGLQAFFPGPILVAPKGEGRRSGNFLRRGMPERLLEPAIRSSGRSLRSPMRGGPSPEGTGPRGRGH